MAGFQAFPHQLHRLIPVINRYLCDEHLQPSPHFCSFDHGLFYLIICSSTETIWAALSPIRISVPEMPPCYVLHGFAEAYMYLYHRGESQVELLCQLQQKERCYTALNYNPRITSRLPRWEMTLNVKHLDPRIITMCSENYQMCSSSDGRERLFPTCKRPAFRFRKLIPCSSPSFVKLPFPPHPGNYFRCTWKKDRKQCIMETLIAWGKWQEKKK